MTRKVAVTGGRDFDDTRHVAHVLNRLHQEDPISLLVHGAATGADALAVEWADANMVEQTYRKWSADWRRLGKAAGPIRNRAMLETEKPDLLVAFPGGRGTADCVKTARLLGIEVLEVLK